jgi:hypothetical protein
MLTKLKKEICCFLITFYAEGWKLYWPHKE